MHSQAYTQADRCTARNYWTSLELCKVLLKVLTVTKTLWTDTAKRQILSRTHFNITATLTWERFTAADTVLQKHNFVT